MKPRDKIFPYLIPESYQDYLNDLPQGFARPIGHGIYVTLAHELEDAMELLDREDIEAYGEGTEALHDLAINNLEALAKAQAVSIHTFCQEENTSSIIMFNAHWAASSCIFLPGLRAMALRVLKTDEVCISVPNRETMLMFSKGDVAFRNNMRAIIRKNEEGTSERPLTWGLFEMHEGRIRPFEEE